MSVPTVTPPVGAAGAAAGVSSAAMVAAVALVAAAGALRLWNIGSGIPYAVGPDEPQVMNRVAHMMKTGDLNPHFFDWPSLTFYMNLVVACVTFLLGSMRGLWSHLDQVGAPELYLTGRQFTALLGTATVGLTFAAGRRWGTGVALVAAALMAVIPNHVRESHYVLTDVPTAFFTTLTLLLSLRAYESPTNRRLLWAAASAGLAASCKYNGAMAIIMPLIVAWTSGGTPAALASRTLGVLGAALAAFLAGTPYAVLDLPAFLNDYARLAFTFARERPGEAGWSIYLKHLSGAMAWPAFLLAVAGGLAAVRRMFTGPGRVPALLIVSFSVVYFAVMASRFQIYGRYMLPLYPFLSLMAATVTMNLASALKRAVKPAIAGTVVAVALIAVPLAAPVANGVAFSRGLGQRSTVGLAYQWILTNVPPGAKVAVEAGALHLPSPYQTLGVRSLLGRSYEDYVRDGVTYFLAASPEFQATLADAQRHPEAFVAYRTLLAPAVLVATFDSSAEVLGPSLRLYQVPK